MPNGSDPVRRFPRIDVPRQPLPRPRFPVAPPPDDGPRLGFFPGPDPFPVDVPVRTPVPFPIPGGEALPGVLARIVLRGGIAGVAIATGVKILEELGQQQLDREIRELEAQLERQRQIRIQRTTEMREILLPPPPQFESPDPEFEVLPRPQILEPIPQSRPVEVETQPLPAELPNVPIGIPAPVIPKPVVAPPTLPQTAPAPAPTTTPRPTTAPRPATRPSTRPAPFLLPFPSPLPFSLPFAQPAPRLAPQPQRLTPVEPAVPRLQPAQPLAQALPLSAPFVRQPTDTRKCEEVKRRRRRKGKCREGFFREYPGKTRYIEWREVDCITRKPKSGSRKLAEDLLGQIRKRTT